MATTLGNVGAASPGQAALVTTAGGAEGATPVVIAAFQNADSLIVAVSPSPLAGAGTAGARPTRTQPAEGWAQPAVQYALLPTVAGTTAAGAAKKTVATAGKTSSGSTAKTSTASTAKTSTASTAKTSTASTAKTSTAKSTDPLAFLSDSKLSVEEKLMKFLAWISDKNEKDLLKKMDEIYAKQKKKESGGKGLLGSIAGGAGKLLGSAVGKIALAAIPGVGPFLAAGGIGLDLLKSSGGANFLGQIAGPILGAGASVLGFPQLAPALTKLAPALGQGAMSLLGATGMAADTESAAKSSSTSTTRSKEGSVSQMDLMELQILQDRQKQAFGTISNILKGIHDTKMMVINNLRA